MIFGMILYAKLEFQCDLAVQVYLKLNISLFFKGQRSTRLGRIISFAKPGYSLLR